MTCIKMMWNCVMTIWHTLSDSLSLSESLFMKSRLIHTRVMNASDEPWSHRSGLIRAAPLQRPNTPHWDGFNHTTAAAYGVEKKKMRKRLMDHVNLPIIHHKTKPSLSLLLWFIFQKRSCTSCQWSLRAECVLNRTQLCGQVHTEWIGWKGYRLLYDSGQVNKKI